MTGREDIEQIAKTSAKTKVDQGLRKYMSQVYNYMTTGLLMTAFVGFLVANTPVQNLFFDKVAVDGGYAVTLSFWGFVAILSPLILVFFINPMLARGKVRAAFGMFMLFSALFGVSLASILLTYTGVSITRIFLVTAGMFAAMSLYGSTTHRDLTSLGSFLLMGLIGVILAVVVNFFLRSPMLYYTYTIIGVFIFIGLSAYDTQRIKRAYAATDGASIMHSKAVLGALALYLDFINLFFMLISLFGDRR